MIAAFAVLLRWFGPANYGVFVIALTALVVLLFAMTGVIARVVIAARGLNTVAGGVIALAAYALWPTWERTRLAESLAAMFDAYRVYFEAVRDAYASPTVSRPRNSTAPASPPGGPAPTWKPLSLASAANPASASTASPRSTPSWPIPTASSTPSCRSKPASPAAVPSPRAWPSGRLRRT